METINYKTEQARLEAFKPGDSSDLWKPTAGQYKVKALTELQKTDPYIEEGKEPQDQAIIRLKIQQQDNVNINAEINWKMAIGKTQASAYGQLIKLASAKQDRLTDQQFMIVVTNDGKKNSYTIVL